MRRTGFFIALAMGLLPTVIFASDRSGVIPAEMGKETLGGGLETEKWNAEAPVDIQSNQMSVNFQSREIIFQGDVRVTQADFFLSAQKVTAVFGSHTDDIRRIVASGDVHVRKADKTAWGDEAVYDRAKGTVLLRGSPRLQQGNNFIRGEMICVFLEEDRMDVEGGVVAEFLLKGKP